MKGTSEVHFWIVTPSFNQAQFIGQTIDGVLRQKNVLTHLYVMDGKSTDDTVSVLKKYGKKIEWVSEKDKGQTDAINKGIHTIAQAIKKVNAHHTDSHPLHIFAYINSDDFYLAGSFQKVAKAFADEHVQWVVGDCQIVDSTNHRIQAPIALYKKMLRMIYMPWMLFIANPIPQPATFLRWDVIEKVGLFTPSLRYTMDYDYWLRTQALGIKPHFIHDELAAFRIHTASKGGSQFIKQFDEQFSTAQKYTTNSFLLGLHHVHNVLTKLVYNVIK